MDMPAERSSPRRSQEPPELEAVYADLNDLLLEEEDVAAFLRKLADLAASLVPGTRAVVRLARDDQLGIPVQRRSRAEPPEQVGRRPPGTAADQPELDAGPGSSGASGLSIPLVVRGVDIGVVRLFADSSRVLTEAELTSLLSFTRHAAPALLLLLRQSERRAVDDQMQEALATRAVIDQALGVLMHARRISSREAFEALREASQKRNRRVSVIAAEVIESLTGHPPEPPRPLSKRVAPRSRTD